MIFYFTGTGNSLYAAKMLDKDIISIPQIIKMSDLHFSADKIGIVCPIYGHEMPAMVKDFIIRSKFTTNYFYLILTYGARHGGAAELADQFMQKVGKKADYIASIEMVDNFLPAFDMNEQVNIEKQVEKHLADIQQDVANKKRFIEKAAEGDKAIHAAYLARVNNKPPKIWSDFLIIADCIGCGICTKVCPGGCIYLENQFAVHNGERCQACYACIHACPKMAIQFAHLPQPEKNRYARYRNAHISLCELVQANNQTEN